MARRGSWDRGPHLPSPLLETRGVHTVSFTVNPKEQLTPAREEACPSAAMQPEDLLSKPVGVRGRAPSLSPPRTCGPESRAEAASIPGHARPLGL